MLNNNQKNADSKNNVAQTPSSLDINVTMVLLAMRIISEAKQQLKIPLRRANLTINQWLVLKIIFLQRANTASIIAKIINIDVSTITRILDKLEQRAYIERVQQTCDRRVILLQLTPKGIRIAEQLYASYAVIFKYLGNELTQDELTMWEKLKNVLPLI